MRKYSIKATLLYYMSITTHCSMPKDLWARCDKMQSAAVSFKLRLNVMETTKVKTLKV